MTREELDALHEKATRDAIKAKRALVDNHIDMLIYAADKSARDAWDIVDMQRAEIGRLKERIAALEAGAPAPAAANVFMPENVPPPPPMPSGLCGVCGESHPVLPAGMRCPSFVTP